MLTAYLIETNNKILENYAGALEISQSALPQLQAEQLAAPGSPNAHVEFGPNGMDALLKRCILRNCTYSLRVPASAIEDGNGATGMVQSGEKTAKDSLSKPKLIYDISQILADIDDEFLKNRALISHQVDIIFE